MQNTWTNPYQQLARVVFFFDITAVNQILFVLGCHFLRSEWGGEWAINPRSGGPSFFSFSLGGEKEKKEEDRLIEG